MDFLLTWRLTVSSIELQNGDASKRRFRGIVIIITVRYENTVATPLHEYAYNARDVNTRIVYILHVYTNLIKTF